MWGKLSPLNLLSDWDVKEGQMGVEVINGKTRGGHDHCGARQERGYESYLGEPGNCDLRS